MHKAAEHMLRYGEEALCFHEALPLGNGRIGAMVYGGVAQERVSLNEDTLWSGHPREKRVEPYPALRREAERLFEEGHIGEAQRLLEERFGDSLTQRYLPLADIRIRTGHSRAKRYCRRLRLDTAVHEVSYTAEGRKYHRETFVSEPCQVLVMRFQCSESRGIDLEISLEGRLKSICRREKDSLFLEGTAPDCSPEYGTVCRGPEGLKYDGKGIRYACVLRVSAEGGRLTFGEHSVKVENADEAVLYFGVRTNFKGYDRFPSGEEYREICRKEVKRAAAADYETVKRESVRSHARLYNRSQISIDGKCRRGISTKERLERLQEGEEDNALYTLLFNYGKYLMISGSRPGTQALNLQGIWNDKLMAPWSSNYTLNINTEMNYWPALTWGLPECCEPLIRMTRELAQPGRETAKIYYGAGGWVCHHSSDLWRLTHPGTNRLPGNAQWGFWNMASGWLSVMLWKYYRYTLDVRYLREIFPIMEGAAGFYRELLVECGGELILPLATSPENNYIRDGEVHALDRSAAMSQEILADLFSAVGRTQEILGRTNTYGDLARKLRRPLIGSSGELCEWHEEHGVWDVHHRHLSHLYGLFPANLFREEEKKAAKKALESRGDGGTGWSLAWKVNLWARLGEGEHALSLLKRQLRPVPAGEEGQEQGGGSYPNLFCAHPPFQIDGNFGAANGIMEMLLQCGGEGNPILLPALPGAWRKGSVRNLYLPGRRKISFAWEDGRILWSKVVHAGPKGAEAGAAGQEGGKTGDEQISDIQL